jgi:hypothetical protein
VTAVTLSDSDIDDRLWPWWLAVLASAEYKLSGIGNSKAREAVQAADALAGSNRDISGRSPNHSDRRSIREGG